MQKAIIGKKKRQLKTTATRPYSSAMATSSPTRLTNP